MNNQIICGFHESELFVNLPGKLTPMRSGCELNFSILNPASNEPVNFRNSLDEKTKSKIQIFTDLGEGDYNMFTRNDDAGHGTIVCPKGFETGGWHPHPTLANKLYCEITATDGLNLKGGDAVHFKWVNIMSTSCEGFCTVIVKFINIGGMDNQTILCQLYKRRTAPRILQFEASPSGGGEGQAVTLHWRVSNAVKGYIIPGNFDIFEGGAQQASSREILLDKNSDSFYLNLSGEDFNTFRRVNVFTVLPVIADFEVSQKKISWNACFVKEVELRIDDGPPSHLKPFDQYELPTAARKISLRCANSAGCIQYERSLPGIPEIDSFIRETTFLPGHKIIKINWETTGLASVALNMWDNEFYEFSHEASGSREQVYEPEIRYRCELRYTTSKGNSGALTL